MVLKQSSLVNRSEFAITCQSCGRITPINPKEVGKNDRLVKIFGMKGLYLFQCECGSRFNLKLDFRRKPRYPCDFSAFYVSLTRVGASKTAMTRQDRFLRTVNSVVKNISVDGLGLQVLGRHDLKPGDELVVTFILKREDTEKFLERKIVVRSVRGSQVGVEFFPSEKKKPEIGFFLME